MVTRTDQPLAPATPDPSDLLRRIGWHPSDWKQIEVYARMSPARKVEQMLWWRAQAIRTLKLRLRSEHPEMDDKQLAILLQEHLDLVREYPRYG
jgi:hypothetical protein